MGEQPRVTDPLDLLGQSCFTTDREFVLFRDEILAREREQYLKGYSIHYIQVLERCLKRV